MMIQLIADSERAIRLASQREELSHARSSAEADSIETRRARRKQLLGINMATHFKEADNPFGRAQGLRQDLSLLLIRVATVPRLRLWTWALPEIPR
jgi:hypothetical protein